MHSDIRDTPLKSAEGDPEQLGIDGGRRSLYKRMFAGQVELNKECG
jgi:hypothetical protein